MKFIKILALVVLLGCSATVALADGSDPRAGVGTKGPGSPSCDQFSFAADAGGAIPANTDCSVSANTKTISVFVPGTDALQLYSPLLEAPTTDGGSPAANAGADALLASLNLVWTQVCGPTTVGGSAAFECTLTAPTIPSGMQGIGDLAALALLAKTGMINDGDCDRDDAILFVPKGCDLFFTTGAIGDLPATPLNLLFSAGEEAQSTSNGNAPVPFPEPGTLSLLLAGVAGFPFLRRRLAR
jgi:hypothetical protein